MLILKKTKAIEKIKIKLEIKEKIWEIEVKKLLFLIKAFKKMPISLLFIKFIK